MLPPAVSIFKPDMAEQMRHGFLIMNPSDGFSNQNRNVYSLDLMALEFLNIMWNSVGDHDFINDRIFNEPRSFLGQNAMSHQNIDFVGASFLKNQRCVNEGLYVIYNVN